MKGAFAMAIALAVAVACASTAPVKVRPPPVAHADEPAVDHSELPAIQGPGADIVRAALAPPVSTLLRNRELARIDVLLACAAPGGMASCVAVPAPVLDEDTTGVLLTTPARDARVRLASASVARAVIEGALAPGARERSAQRRALTLLDERAVFALDDLPELLRQAKRNDRRRILAAAHVALERSVDLCAQERVIVEAAAVRSGVTRAQLLARRSGLDEAALRSLVEEALTRTAPLLASIASDVTLLADVQGPAPDLTAARAAATQARRYADPILIDAIARAASASARSRGGTADAGSDWTRSLVVDLRIAGLSVTALLDGAEADARDRLASRILMNELADDNDVVKGAGALLAVDEGGVVVERFVALLATPALVRLLRRGARPEDWLRAWAAAPPLEERGYPEAFIELLEALPELTGA